MTAKKQKYSAIDGLVMEWTKYQILTVLLWSFGYVEKWWIILSPALIPIAVLCLSWLGMFVYFFMKPKYERYKMRRLTKRKMNLGDDIEKFIAEENG